MTTKNSTKKPQIVIEKADLTLFIQNLCKSAWAMGTAFGCIRAQQLDLLPQDLVGPDDVAEAMAILGKKETIKLMQLIDNFEKTVGLDVTLFDEDHRFEYQYADFQYGADVVT